MDFEIGVFIDIFVLLALMVVRWFKWYFAVDGVNMLFYGVFFWVHQQFIMENRNVFLARNIRSSKILNLIKGIVGQ